MDRHLLWLLVLLASQLGLAQAASLKGVVAAGSGGYLTALPAGRSEPPKTIYKTARVRGPIPTNKWWSSLAWVRFSEPMYAHPLALRAVPEGLRVYYPGPDVHANRSGIYGEMADDGNDLTLENSLVRGFPDARLDGYSDWFVTASFASGHWGFRTTFGHGSPFVYALYEHGVPTVTFPSPPAIWHGNTGSAVLGVTINRRHYALFGPSGATWKIAGRTLTCDTGGKPYFSLAILPDATQKTLERFRRHAYCHVVDSRADWTYDECSSMVTTQFRVTTRAYEGKDVGAMFALYPHQWRTTTSPLLPKLSYQSVCGTMKLIAGRGFTTRMTYHGVLPALPPTAADRDELRRLVAAEAGRPVTGPKDTYWEGKWLGGVAAAIPIAEQVGDRNARSRLLAMLKGRLEEWFTAVGGNGAPKDTAVFYYNRPWGTLIGYPASFQSDTDLNDHHFHYGYFLRAAAEIARIDPGWADGKHWGGMLHLLQRDIASGDRHDPLFPYLRHFDPYAGHSWASGNGAYPAGNNQESSSEAMNAWTGLILLGESTGDTAMRNLGIYLYTTEMEAINAYWFDVMGTNRPQEYTPSVVTMVWGGKMVNETWFSDAPEAIHGINYIPIHGGSLYLGLFPEYARRNYNALLEEKGSEEWGGWSDLIWMYRALSDPDDALRQYAAGAASQAPADGVSRAAAYQWIHCLAELGQVDREITADTPLFAVFRKGAIRAYVVYSGRAEARTVTFSDGYRLRTAGKGFSVKQRRVTHLA